MLNIYLPPYSKMTDSYFEDPSNKNFIKKEATRMLQNNNALPKMLDGQQLDAYKKKSNLLLRPKLYNLKFLRPHMKLTNDKDPTLRTKSKTLKTNFDLNLARSVDLNSLSTQFSDIDDELSEPFELSDSELVEKSYLEFYEKTIDLVRKQKSEKLNLKRVSSIPLLSASKEQSCRRDLVKRVLKFKNVFGYNISSNNLLSSRNEDVRSAESDCSTKPRYNTAKTSKSSSLDRRSSKSSKSCDSVTYLELISDRKLNLINENKSKYLNFFK
jgi:hypothetical protein